MVIYVLSRGRSSNAPTLELLRDAGLKHYVVVEEDEANAYRNAYPHSDVIVLDPAAKTNYDFMDSNGLRIGTGAGPVRNFIHQHAFDNHKNEPRYWMFDDDIDSFLGRGNNGKNKKLTPRETVSALNLMFRWCCQFENLAIAAPTLSFVFMPQLNKKTGEVVKSKSPVTLNRSPIIAYCVDMNCRIMWRGRLNEDIIRNVDAMKRGYCTATFRNFAFGSPPSCTNSGGNTDLYGTRSGVSKSLSYLNAAHPFIATPIFKFNRVHFRLQLSKWKENKLVRRKYATKINDSFLL